MRAVMLFIPTLNNRGFDMANNAISAGDSGTFLESAASFLKFGPLGLAGLMLALVVVALSIGHLDTAKERLLRQFLYIGAFCFVVASVMAFLPGFIASSHMLYFRILPHNMGAESRLPPPVITINNERLEPLRYKISDDVTAIVDVSDAIDVAELYRNQNTRQSQALSEIVTTTDAAIADLRRATSFALDNGCPGGSSGRPIPHGPDIAALNNAASSVLARAKASAIAALEATASQ